MILQELKTEIGKYQYFEDDGVLDISLAAIIATRLKLGDPIWLILIGPSSGGKSQILRPLALTDERFMHRIDDLTENTFLSGMGAGGKDISLLSRIGPTGILVMSDLTVLFSKNKEARSAILSQFRMLYDGEMIKHSGSKNHALVWKGRLGILAGSTPSVYRHFEEVADMGERFLYYRMKSFNPLKATQLAIKRNIPSHELDSILGEKYKEYLKGIITTYRSEPIVLPPFVLERIELISVFAEKVRTGAHMDYRNLHIDDIPVPAYPMRTALQLIALASGMYILKQGQMKEKEVLLLEWCAYSMANEKKRAVLRFLANFPFAAGVKTQMVADEIGLATEVTNKVLQNLSSIGVLKRNGDANSLYWHIKEKGDWEIVRRLESISGFKINAGRAISKEEHHELEMSGNLALEEF